QKAMSLDLRLHAQHPLDELLLRHLKAEEGDGCVMRDGRVHRDTGRKSWSSPCLAVRRPPQDGVAKATSLSIEVVEPAWEADQAGSARHLSADLVQGGLNVTQKAVVAKDGVLLRENRHRAPDGVGGSGPGLDRAVSSFSRSAARSHCRGRAAPGPP